MAGQHTGSTRTEGSQRSYLYDVYNTARWTHCNRSQGSAVCILYYINKIYKHYTADICIDIVIAC